MSAFSVHIKHFYKRMLNIVFLLSVSFLIQVIIQIKNIDLKKCLEQQKQKGKKSSRNTGFVLFILYVQEILACATNCLRDIIQHDFKEREKEEKKYGLFYQYTMLSAKSPNPNWHMT